MTVGGEKKLLFTAVATILAVLAQTGVVFWWGGAISTKVDSIRYQVERLQHEQYTPSDALKDFGRLGDRITRHDRRLDKLEDRVK